MKDMKQTNAHGVAPGVLPPDACSAEEVVRRLHLEPLPHEGGWFRRTATGPADATGRPAYTVIQALFTSAVGSALHRLQADELWFWQAGDAMDQWQLSADGEGRWYRLGPDVTRGEVLHLTVPAGGWQGARVVAGGRWSLVSCVVVPGFCWEDFTLGERSALLASYPAWREAIVSLTRPD
jgi:uncharacterized protein